MLVALHYVLLSSRYSISEPRYATPLATCLCLSTSDCHRPCVIPHHGIASIRLQARAQEGGQGESQSPKEGGGARSFPPRLPFALPPLGCLPVPLPLPVPAIPLAASSCSEAAPAARQRLLDPGPGSVMPSHKQHSLASQWGHATTMLAVQCQKYCQWHPGLEILGKIPCVTVAAIR